MNNIIENNTFILNFIIVVSLLILIVILGYKMWTKYIGKTLRFKLNLSTKEDFSQVSLEKQVKLYDDYRNYLDGKDLLTRTCASNKRMLPYIVSPSCFTDKYIQCMKESAHQDPSEPDEYTHMHSHEKLDGFNDMYDDKFVDIDFYGSNGSVEHDTVYSDGFKASSAKCQDQSYDMCLTDNFNFI